MATGELKSYSEQELVSCNKSILTNHGCNGGLMDRAFEWCKSHPLALESDYPYVSGNGQNPACDSSKESKANLTVKSY